MARGESGSGVGGRTGSAARKPAQEADRAGGARPRAPRLLSLNADPIATLEERSRQIDDPVEKLRFLRSSLQRYEDVDQKLQAVPGAPLRWLAYRLTRVDAARALFSGNPNGALDGPVARGQALPRRARRAVNTALVILVAAAGLAIAAYPRQRTELPEEPAAALAPLRAPEPASAPVTLPIAEQLPDVPRAVSPERIWMVQAGKGFELYSNGLRIDTSYAVHGEPRRYRVFDAERGMGGVTESRPIGIVFHTSESDIWPLEESFNAKLRDSSHGLLAYLKRNRVYHYLIDRFGQVFRVVEEETKANHAGMSIWNAGNRVFLNLNGPTIGVSFETRWEGGRALPITRAQLEAGRSLSDYLRHKWSMEPDLCITHGLASVNPRKHLIGHHVDWARGFPFSAFGLPDHYERPAPAVALFGFGRDESLAERMGEPWPGVLAAERELQQEARTAGRTLAELRRDKTTRYDRWLAEQAAVTNTAGNTRAEAQEPRRHASGG